MADVHVEQDKKQKTTHTQKNDRDGASNTGNKVSTITPNLPETYPWIDDTVSAQERVTTLVDEIITDCKMCELEAGFEHYIDSEIGFDEHDPRPLWRAVWRSRDLGCDVLVMVKAIRYPEATVDIAEPFCHQPNSYTDLAGGDGYKTKEDVTKFLSSKSNKVPLMEICPVFEEPIGQVNKTSEATDGANDEAEEYDEDEVFDINHIAEGLEIHRFFYTYIYRVFFDERYGGDFDFSNVHLCPRMQLHYDVQCKEATKETIESYTKVMAEYPKKAWLYSKIRSNYEYPNRDKELPKIGQEIINCEHALEKLAVNYYDDIE